MKTINICVTTTNNKYIKYLAVFLKSLVDFLDNQYQYTLFVLTNSALSENTKKNIEYKLPPNFRISYIIVDESIFKEQQKIWNTFILYYRLVLHLYLDVDKVIFIDTDTIIRWDISSLFFTELWDNLIWAAKDCVLRNHKILKKYNISRYFNAWVQLINLKKWKEEKIWEKALIFLKDNFQNLPLYDQDTLNILLKDRWLCISPRRNWLWWDKIWYKESQYTKQEFRELHNPTIVHFAWNTHRPWSWLICLHPYRYLYFKYIFKTKYWDMHDVYMFIFRVFSSNIVIRYIWKFIVTTLWIIRKYYLKIFK